MLHGKEQYLRDCLQIMSGSQRGRVSKDYLLAEVIQEDGKVVNLGAFFIELMKLTCMDTLYQTAATFNKS